MDGWGHGKKDKSNAVHIANTPFIDSLYENYPNAELRTDGLHVGLPEGQMGNSEVGHLNIGAGRIVYQDLAKINKAIDDNELESNPELVKAFSYAKENNKNVHFIGLVSNGGVHSSQEHLHALCSYAKNAGVNHFVHAFTDGRDCDPKSGLQFIENLENHLTSTGGTLASIIGRYYAMDRDNRWERVKLAYDLLLSGKGTSFNSGVEAVKASYANDITDEFIEPVSLTENGNIEIDDVVICFNFRTDRCREITIALTQQDIDEENMRTLPLYYVTATEYDKSFKGVNVLFKKDNLKMTLGETVSKAGLTQVRIAETEKYPHVTFFFSGGEEKEFAGERRLLVNSPKVATYDLQPEMSAPEVTSSICNDIETNQPDFICLNFANPDMVGHTGILEAVIKAVETTDQSVQKVVETGLKHGYQFIVIADHGNADFVVNNDGSPNTAHTTNPVPVFAVTDKYKTIKNGILADVAPTILHMMGVEQPVEMSGENILI